MIHVSPVELSPLPYHVLPCLCPQNTVGGGKPKMRWYFGQKGWPTSSVLGGKVAETEEEKTQLVDVLQDWKTDKFKEIIGAVVVCVRGGGGGGRSYWDGCKADRASNYGDCQRNALSQLCASAI